MKKFFISISLVYLLFSSCYTLNAVGIQSDIIPTQPYNPADHDPGIPIDWIEEDGTFGE